jgi:hypothetical protein
MTMFLLFLSSDNAINSALDMLFLGLMRFGLYLVHISFHQDIPPK